MGATSNIDPVEGWKIVDDKLYLNYSREIKKNGKKISPATSERLIKIGQLF
jgi:hypothetical protein